MKNKILAASLVGLMSLLLVASVASAEDNGLGFGREKENKVIMTNSGKDIQPSASITPSGEFKVTGVTVNSVNAAANTVNVSLYGFTKDVNISGAALIGAGKNIGISDLLAGDKLTATGKIVNGIVSVKEIRDITYASRNQISNTQIRIQTLQDMIAKLQAQLQQLQGQH